MRVIVVALLGAALVAVATATAATTAKDPMTLILRQADMPRGTTYEADDGVDTLKEPLRTSGLTGAGALYLGAAFSKEKGFLEVSGIVITTESPASARKAFAVVRKARDAFRRSLGGDKMTPVSLPPLGTQQVALIDPPGNEGIGHAEVVVRRNSVVWVLHVKLERRPAPPVAELVGELKRYAAKQKTRVGAG